MTIDQHPVLHVPALVAENERLRARVADLEAELHFLRAHPTLAAGMRGEQLVARLIAGERTLHNAPADFIAADGQRIEVKFARLNTKYRARPETRWAWGKIFGEGGGKNFDWLLLVGEADPTARQRYADPSSPVVMFSVPFEEVPALTMPSNGGRYRAIQLMSDPERAARSRAAPLFTRFQVTTRDLEQRFGLRAISASVGDELSFSSQA